MRWFASAAAVHWAGVCTLLSADLLMAMRATLRRENRTLPGYSTRRKHTRIWAPSPAEGARKGEAGPAGDP